MCYVLMGTPEGMDILPRLALCLNHLSKASICSVLKLRSKASYTMTLYYNKKILLQHHLTAICLVAVLGFQEYSLLQFLQKEVMFLTITMK